MKLLDREQLEKLYLIELFSIDEISKRLNVSKATIKKNIDNYGLKRDRSKVLSKSISGKRDELNKHQNEIPKEKFYQYYIVEDHGYYETAEHFGISTWALDRLRNSYGIKKDQSNTRKKMLNKKYEEAGSKEKYYEELDKKIKNIHIQNYGSLDEYNRQRSKKIADTWNAKTPEEKAAATAKTLANGGGWNYKTIRKTLKDRYGVNNSYALAKFVNNSKTNQKFKAYLQSKNIIHDIEKYLYREDGSFMKYDFIIKNYLLELNPTATHNSTFKPYGDKKGISKDYHYNKSKLAYDNGFQCICIWDWDDWDKILKLISPEPKVDNFSIKEINIEEAKNFLDNNHIFGYVEDDIRLGVFIEDKLVSILTLEKLSENSYNILRIYNENYLLDLINYFVSNYNPSSIYYVCNLDKYVPDNFIKLGFELKDKDYNIYNIHINSNADVEIYGAGLEYYEWCKE